MIITIDGPAGSGKSAAATWLAQRLKIPHLDTGAMYRAVALFALERGLLADPAGLAEACRGMELGFDWGEAGAPILLNGRNVAEVIREPRVTAVTHVAADNVAVREELVRRQRAIAGETGSIVSEGRDQGSIVFPQADFKFYLDGAAEERARRRIAQMQKKGLQAEPEKVLKDILERDARDKQRPVGGLLQTADAIHVDTTNMSLEQVVEELFRLVTKGGAR